MLGNWRQLRDEERAKRGPPRELQLVGRGTFLVAHYGVRNTAKGYRLASVGWS